MQQDPFEEVFLSRQIRLCGSGYRAVMVISSVRFEALLILMWGEVGRSDLFKGDPRYTNEDPR